MVTEQRDDGVAVMLTGRIFSGEEADGFGVLSRLVSSDELLGTAVELALSVTRNSEYGVWMSKKGMWLAMDAPSLRHAMELENRTQVRPTVRPLSGPDPHRSH